MLDIKISEDDVALQDAVQRFSDEVLAPKAKEIDETAVFAGLHFEAMAELGLMGLNLPEEFGGPGASPIALYLGIEAMAGACAATTSAVTAHYMATDAIEIGTNEELKRKYLPKAASGELLGAYGMTEPRGGSNPADMRVRAVHDGDTYRISGTKHFISNGGNADFVVLYCVTDPDAEPKYKGISAIVVDAGTPGFTPGKIEPTHGLRGGHIWELHFDDCVVPAANLVSDAGTGFKNSMIGLDGARLDVAAICTGIARVAISEAVGQWRDRTWTMTMFDRSGKPTRSISCTLGRILHRSRRKGRCPCHRARDATSLISKDTSTSMRSGGSGAPISALAAGKWRRPSPSRCPGWPSVQTSST